MTESEMGEVLSATAEHRRALKITFVLTSAYFVIEVVGGVLTNSLALLADAAHMLTDVGGLGLALFAAWMSQKPTTPDKTYGYYRVEILAALANAVVLFLVSFYWTITSGMESLSAHVVLAEVIASDEAQEILEALNAQLKEEFGIDHATLQLEYASLAERETRL